MKELKSKVTRTVSFVLMLSMILSLILTSTGCSKKASSNKKLQIVTTIFPEYDWVMNILGDNPGKAEVTLLLDNGVDLHSYQPSTEDILKISTCDMFIYVGGESDEWVFDALENATNKDMVVINLLDVLGDSVREEEIIEGMEAQEEEEGEEEGEEEIEYDEHVWLSLRNAKTICEKIEEGISKIDKDNKNVYKENLDKYTNELSKLDKEYEETVSAASKDTVVFGDRFPFVYMIKDYGLNYYAAFVGCSAETEASFETVVFLSEKIDELGLGYVLTIENSDKKIAETIVDTCKSEDVKIQTLDSMQATTLDDYKNGTNYLSVMKDNLSVLSECLN